MTIRLRSFLDVQCDLCESARTVEGEHPSAALDTLGYRRVKVSIESVDPRTAGDPSDKRELVVCAECLKRVRGSLRILSREDEAERQLEEMKRQMKTGGG